MQTIKAALQSRIGRSKKVAVLGIGSDLRGDDFAGMAAQISDEHITAFATESTWDGLADALAEKYRGLATRIVLYNALADPQRVERYGEVAQRLRC